MRHGGDKRGSALARRRSKLALLMEHGDGESCPCTHCGCKLSFETLERDRIEPGGSYRLENLQPSCSPCNKQRSNNREWRFATA